MSTALQVNVRPAAACDAARIAGIYAHHVLHGTATFELDPPSVGEMERRMADVAARGLPWLVAEARGTGREPAQMVVGYGYANAFRPRPAYRYTVEDSIYLDPAWMGRGIGRMLLTRLIEDCEAAGCRQMIAVIGDSTNTPSVALHRALGFSEAGVQKNVGLKFGRWLDTVQMQRALGEGAATIPATAGGAMILAPG